MPVKGTAGGARKLRADEQSSTRQNENMQQPILNEEDRFYGFNLVKF
jgi:hypothetical protein